MSTKAIYAFNRANQPLHLRPSCPNRTILLNPATIARCEPPANGYFTPSNRHADCNNPPMGDCGRVSCYELPTNNNNTTRTKRRFRCLACSNSRTGAQADNHGVASPFVCAPLAPARNQFPRGWPLGQVAHQRANVQRPQVLSRTCTRSTTARHD